MVTESRRSKLHDATVHAVATSGLVLGANDAGSWIWWDWVAGHGDELYTAGREHVILTFWAIVRWGKSPTCWMT